MPTRSQLVNWLMWLVLTGLIALAVGVFLCLPPSALKGGLVYEGF